METSKLILVAANGRKATIESAGSLGRAFVYTEFGLLDDELSRNHCQIRWKNGTFWILDGSTDDAKDGISSLGGTFLDDRRLTSGHWEEIPRSATLRIGATTLSLRHEAPYSAKFDIMISYSRKDETAVLKIHQEMKNLGLRPWVDQAGGNDPAAHYLQGIEKIMAETNAVAIFWGGDHMGNTQEAEVEIVTNYHVQKRIKSLFLIILPGSQNPTWRAFLNNVDHYDLRKPGEHDRLMRDLAKALLP